MSQGVFISYRRDDAPGYTRALYEALEKQFGAAQVYMDVDAIKPGVDFVEALEAALASCHILIAVIGENWLIASNDRGRRIDDPNDFVRMEIATALKRGIPVVPLLVEGATMPSAEDVPSDLKPLARRNALAISHARFSGDLARVVAAIDETVSAAVGPIQSAREYEAVTKDAEKPRDVRVTVAWIGACAIVLAALIAGVFAWVGREAPSGSASTPNVSAEGGGVAAGGNIEGSTITTTTTKKAPPAKD
jgi:hypothetical protein